MKTNTESRNASWAQIQHHQVVPSGLRLLCLAALALGLAVPARAETPPAPIPFSDLDARATAEYHGDALSVTATADGARLRCGFQKLQALATPEGLWLESTAPGAAGKLRVTASAICRAGLSTLNPVKGRDPYEALRPQLSTLLPATGIISVEDQMVRFTRPGLREEYSVSVDGVRQDFIIESPPLNSQRSTLNQSAGDLRVELALSGARAEAAAGGIKLRLEGSGRTLAYSRLRVEDAAGRELTARLEVLSSERLAVNVADAHATYPIRIDPTFSDANWVSLNPGVPGANGGVLGIVVDGSGNVYVAGNFTLVGTVLANHIAKWDGSVWSALGSGMGGGNDFVRALVVSGTNLFAGGSFTMAGGVAANNIAKWDGSAWSAVGSGMNRDGYVSALAVSGTDLYAGGYFTTAGGVEANCTAKWNGSTWTALGSGMNDNVAALAVSGNNLYVGGQFTKAGGVEASGIAKWGGSAWSALAYGMRNGDGGGSVNALAVSGTNLYAGGGFTEAGGVAAKNIAKWNGSAWSALGSGMNAFVNALAVSGNNLYAGGSFTAASGMPANYIARWDGSTWSALGSGMSGGPDPEVDALAADGVGHLFVGGTFDLAGTNETPNLAQANLSSPVQAYRILHNFTGSDGSTPRGKLVRSGPRLYGTTCFGGGASFGTVFGINTDGSDFAVLKNFGGGDGAGPYAGLALLGATLYGTTALGGSYHGESINKGTAFRLNTDGSGFTGLATFLGIAEPYAGLALAGTNLYGTTATGDSNPHGSVFSLSTNGGATLLKSFTGSDGAGPRAALALVGTTLFGTTVYGGTSNKGTIFRLSTDGSGFTILRSLGGSDAESPYAGLAVSGTTLYGTTTYGGTSGNGTVFRLNMDGSEFTILKNFAGSDGKWPFGGVAVRGTILYGTTWAGGDSNSGTVYKLNADGSGYSVIKNFTGSDGANPYADLLLPGATLYGTTESGGSANLGVVFRLALPIPPVIITPPLSQVILAGDTVTFSIEADGEAPLAYQWFFNNANAITGATNSSLALTNVQLFQAGLYTLVITNIYGAITSSPAMLNVVPLNSTVTNCTETALRAALATGETVTFACDGTITLSNMITVAADTVLDATGHQITISGGNAVRVFWVNNNAALTLINLTVANGFAQSGAGSFSSGGGGIFNSHGTVNATNCTFADNTATVFNATGSLLGGGAIRNESGLLRLLACDFARNQARGDTYSFGGAGNGGGAIYNGGTGILDLCKFTDNVAAGVFDYMRVRKFGGSGLGGAIFNDGTLQVARTAFDGNRANGAAASGDALEGGGDGMGGAICNQGNLMLTSSTLANNGATGGTGGTGFNGGLGDGGVGGRGGQGAGGGLFNSGTASAINSTFTGNFGRGGSGGTGGNGRRGEAWGWPNYPTGGGGGGRGGQGAGGGLFNSGTASAINSTFTSNFGGGGSGGTGGTGGDAAAGTPYGGGLGGSGGTGGAGFGAVCDTSGLLHLTNCTVVFNVGSAGGGGAGGLGGSGVAPGRPGLPGTNGVAAGGINSIGCPLVNTLLATNSANCFGRVTDGGHNLSSDNSCTFTNVGSLNNTDPKLGPLANNGGPTLTMALLPGSPAIDAGDNASAPPSDQRGFPRPLGARADIGAYEYCYPVALRILPAQGGGVGITVYGSSSQMCWLLTSTNLSDWQSIATNQIGADGTVLFQDNCCAGDTQRFYRVAVP